jgi:hypothetical protein
MSQLINRNNKQSGGTFVTIGPANGSSGKFIRSEDNKIILTSLLESYDDIICISVQSSNSIVFACRLPVGINIKLHNDRNHEEEKHNFCIKVSFIRTGETPQDTERLTFEYNGHTFNKKIKSLAAVNEEGIAQKQAFDTLQKRCPIDFIPDTIAMDVITPDIFKERIFREPTGIEPSASVALKPSEPVEPSEPAISREVIDPKELTIAVIKWIIQQATAHHLNLHIFCMDYFAEHIVFGQYLDELPEPDDISYIESIKEFHNVGYYHNVYKIVEFVGAYIISILHITGNWNSDLNDGNIMVLPSSTSDNTSNIKLIDFGLNRQLQKNDVRLKIIGYFRGYYISLFDYFSHRTNLLSFLNSLNSEAKYGGDFIITAFTECYDDIIINFATHIQRLLRPDTSTKDKQKIVFKILMFLAFIDGLIQHQELKINRIQCQPIMKYIFTRDIFGDLSTFLKYSSLDYHKYLDKPLNPEDTTLLPVIRGVALFQEGVTKKGVTFKDRYTMLCHIILDKICQHVAELVREPPAIGGPDSGGGKDISKKYTRALRKSTKRTTRRRPRRKSTKRLRRRRTLRK